MKTMYYIKALQAALIEEMERDQAVFMMGEDIGEYGGAFGVSRGMLKRFGPERILETPMSETSFVGIAVGAALCGMRPIVEIMFMDFITLCMDQIVNHASKIFYIYGEQFTVPIVIRTPAGGGRRYGPSHSQNLTAMFLNVPGLKIVSPSTPNDAYHLLKASIRDENPVLFIESKLLYWTKGDVGGASVPIGKARVVKEGNDLTIISYSRMIQESLFAVELLDEEGISVEIIDMRTLAPVDMETIEKSAKKTGRVLVVEEGYRTGGVGAEIAARIQENCLGALKAPIFRLGCLDLPIAYSPKIEDAIFVDKKTIANECKKLMMEAKG